MSSQLQRLLRGARRDLRVTQEELARASEGFTTPISREFVANLETAGLPGTVKKFFTYSWLVDADIASLVELSVLEKYEPSEPLDVDSALAACRDRAERGEVLEAVGIAISAANALPPDEEDTSVNLARLVLAGAVAARRGGLWRLARELAERAFETDDLAPRNRVRAELIMAQALHALGREHLALSVLEKVDRSLFESSPALGAAYWHDVTVVWRTLGDVERALEAAHMGLANYAQIDEPASTAVLTSVRALLLSDAGHAGADAAAHNAVRLAHGVNDRFARCRTLLNACRVILRSDDLDAANELIDEASDLAKSLSDRGDLFDVNLAQCELMHRRGQKRKARDLMRKLQMAALRTRPDRLTRLRMEELAISLVG